MAKHKSRAGYNKQPNKNAQPQNQTQSNSSKLPEGMIGISSKFALLNRLITRDLNNNVNTPTFSLYSKDDITTYLSNPYKYEKQLRKAVIYINGVSSF